MSKKAVATVRGHACFVIFETLGYLLCELAFKTSCRGPFTYAYRAGCGVTVKQANFRS